MGQWPFTLGGFMFTEPVPLRQWYPPQGGGIYAILCKTYLRWEPIYIGQTESFADRGIGQLHHASGCWQRHADLLGGALYISTHRDDDPMSRYTKETLLIKALNPPCNERR